MRTKWTWIAGLLALVAASAAYPYVGWVVNRVVGTNTVVYVEYDGRQRTMIVGPAAPIPDWIPAMPWSLTLSAAAWPLEPATGTQDVLVHAGAADVMRFYRDRLTDEGFEIEPAEPGDKNPLLGIEGMLLAHHDATEVRVMVRSRQSLVNPARVVQVNWYSKR